MSQEDVGKQLLAQGCRQGALFVAEVPMVRLVRPDGEWVVETDGTIRRLVVVSQDCDVASGEVREPSIEAIEVREPQDASEAASARKGNSARVYSIGDRIADARRRVHIRKTALLGVAFEQAFPSNRQREAFARWVGGRYSRPAIAGPLVDHVQRPIVRAYEALRRRGGPLLPVVDALDELRFSIDGPGSAPAIVNLLAMHEGALSIEEEADLAAWLEDALVCDGGTVDSIRFQIRSEATVSVADYAATTRLQLDHFSLDDR